MKPPPAAASTLPTVIAPTTPCPVCGADDAAPCWSAPPTAVVRCRRCGLRYVSPRLAPRVEDAQYYVDQYLPEIAIHGAGVDGPIRDIERYVAVGRVLDVGCALGDHLVAARARGWHVVGIEPAPFAAVYARTHHGLTVHQGTLDDCDVDDRLAGGPFAGAGFDAVVLAEVIEHVPDPLATLRRVAALLRPGGVAWLSTPNANSLAAGALGDAWDRIEPVGHLTYFDPPTLARLIRAADLHVAAMNAIDVDVPGIAARAAAAGRPASPRRLTAAARARRAAVAAARALHRARHPRDRAPAGLRWLAGETIVAVARR